MRKSILLLGLAAGLALTACDSVMTSSGPPPAGTSVGTSTSPVRQEVRNIAGANSPNASAGTPTFSGTNGARPSFDRAGTSTDTGIGGGTATFSGTNGARPSFDRAGTSTDTGAGGGTTLGPIGTTRTRPN